MNPSIRYTAWAGGPEWVLLVGRRVVVALDPLADPAVVSRLWEAVAAEGSSVDRVLDHVPAEVGGVPLPFAIVGVPSGEDGVEDEAVTVFVHAGAAVDVLSAGARRRVVAEEGPWHRERIEDVSHVSVGGPSQLHAPAMPIVEGVVRCTRIDLLFADELLTQPRTGSFSVAESAHDGHTVLRSDLPRPRDVDAVAPAVEVRPRTVMYGYRLNGSQPFALDVPHYFGRNPKKPSSIGRVVVVQSSTKSVSATHVEIEQVGDSVVVTDLKSTNGTSLIVPGSSWQRLAAGQSLVVPAGTFIDMGDGNVIEIMPGQPLAPGH